MKSIRLKITIHLNGNHALSIDQLNALKPPIERGIAAALPDWDCCRYNQRPQGSEDEDS